MDHYCGRHTTILNFQEDYVNLQILIRQEQKTHKGDVPCDKTVLAISNNLQAGLIQRQTGWLEIHKMFSAH